MKDILERLSTLEKAGGKDIDGQIKKCVESLDAQEKFRLIRQCCELNLSCCVMSLLKNYNSSFASSEEKVKQRAWFSSVCGHQDLVLAEFFIAKKMHVDRHVWVNAASAGNTGLLMLLQKARRRSTKESDVFDALCFASLAGKIESVKYLASLTDPAQEKSLPLQWAIRGGHTEVSKFLFPLSSSVEASYAMQEKRTLNFHSFSKVMASVSLAFISPP